MVLCKITRVISTTSNSNCYYHNRRKFIHFELNCCFKSVFCSHNKRNKLLANRANLCHLLTGSASEANFVQTERKEELSLNQAVNLGNRESCEFHVIHFGSSIITQIPCNLHHFSYFPQGKQCIEQERKSCKFCIICFGSSLIT